MNQLGGLLLLLSLPFFTSCIGLHYSAPAPRSPSLEESLVITSDEPFVHSETGTVFPRRVANFKRTRMVQYDEKAYDLSVGYDYRVPKGTIAVTLYLYPGPKHWDGGSSPKRVEKREASQLRDALKGATDGILGAREGSRIEGEEPSTLLPGRNGLRVMLTYPIKNVFGEEIFMSEADVFLLESRWFFKVRATYYPELYDLAQQRMKELLAEINLPGAIAK